jgi:hypothetical protein
MNETAKIRGFGDRLLDQETLDPQQKQRYERQVQAMLQQRLSLFGRIVFAVLALAGVVATITFAHAAQQNRPHDKEALGIVAFWVAASLLSLSWTVLAGWPAVTGKWNLRTQRPFLAAIAPAMGFFLMTMAAFKYVLPNLHAREPLLMGTQFVLMGFFSIVIAGLCAILVILYRTWCSTQERLLQIEYRIADLAEKLDQGDRGEGQGTAVR